VLSFRKHPRCSLERLTWEVAEYLTSSLVRCFLCLGKMVTIVAKVEWEIRLAAILEVKPDLTCIVLSSRGPRR